VLRFRAATSHVTMWADTRMYVRRHVPRIQRTCRTPTVRVGDGASDTRYNMHTPCHKRVNGRKPLCHNDLRDSHVRGIVLGCRGRVASLLLHSCIAQHVCHGVTMFVVVDYEDVRTNPLAEKWAEPPITDRTGPIPLLNYLPS